MQPSLYPSDSLPKASQDHETILASMAALQQGDANWKSGKTWCLVYHAGDEHSEFIKQAHNQLMSANALNPMAFKSLRKMEADVIAMTCRLFHGDEQCVGSMTAGGTESILLAVKTYKEWAKRHKMWIWRPNIVIARSAHAAFEKAADYFGVRLKFVENGPDHRVDLDAMRKKIDRNTIALVASAPQYPQGTIDPIAEIGRLAQKHELGFHVDACIGGYALPFIEKNGRPVPPWDFRVPGVTSISADLHKYGYTAKGASTLTWRSMDYMRHQFFISTDWPGGIYASPTIAGTRPGGPIAAAWAGMLALGEEGYCRLMAETMAVKDKLVAGIESIPEIEVLGDPPSTLVSFAFKESTGLNTFALADYLTERHWHFDRHQNPNSIHCTCNPSNAGHEDAFLSDIRAGIDYIKAHPEVAESGDAAMYGMMAKVPKSVRGVVKYGVLKLMESMYSGDEMPDLSKLGEDPSDPLLFRMMHKYGDTVKRFI